MKHFALLIILSSTAYNSRMLGGSLDSNLRKGCDALYAEHIDSILIQFKGVATQGQLKDYKKFMLAIKLRNDMLFKITPFEQSLKSEDLAVLRAPLTNYTACRSQVGVAFGYDYQTANPSKKVLAPCETSYAAHMQNTLNAMKNGATPATLKRFEDFMLFLKYYADLGFVVKEFERKTAYEVRTRLREPLVRYITCRDSLLLLQSKVRPQ